MSEFTRRALFLPRPAFSTVKKYATPTPPLPTPYPPPPSAFRPSPINLLSPIALSRVFPETFRLYRFMENSGIHASRRVPTPKHEADKTHKPDKFSAGVTHLFQFVICLA